jgi:hypothetical protein
MSFTASRHAAASEILKALGEGESVGVPDREASASRRNADAAVSLWLNFVVTGS